VPAPRAGAGTERAPRARRAESSFRFPSTARPCYIREQTLTEPEGTTPLRTTTANGTSQSEITILARVLGNEEGQLPPDVARYILTLDFSERDKARMHDLAVRNQDGALAPAEKEEMFAYTKAGSLLGILQSKARRVLGVKPKERTRS
jgi:hypothetical protein